LNSHSRPQRIGNAANDNIVATRFFGGLAVVGATGNFSFQGNQFVLLPDDGLAEFGGPGNHSISLAGGFLDAGVGWQFDVSRGRSNRQSFGCGWRNSDARKLGRGEYCGAGGFL